MRKPVAYSVSLIMSLLLCSCGDTSTIDTLVDKQNAGQNSNTSVVQTESAETEKKPETSASENATEISSASSGEYDVDLTVLDSTMIYGQLYDMLNDPESYNGKTVRAEGPFSYFKDEQTGKKYFAVLIKDATACCAQGIEFVLKGNPVYPYDYPDIDTNIVITGVCDIYKEGNGVFCQLLDAEYEIKK